MCSNAKCSYLRLVCGTLGGTAPTQIRLLIQTWKCFLEEFWHSQKFIFAKSRSSLRVVLSTRTMLINLPSSAASVSTILVGRSTTLGSFPATAWSLPQQTQMSFEGSKEMLTDWLIVSCPLSRGWSPGYHGNILCLPPATLLVERVCMGFVWVWATGGYLASSWWCRLHGRWYEGCRLVGLCVLCCGRITIILQKTVITL